MFLTPLAPSQRGGQQIGSIVIQGAQIGRQQKSATSDMDDNSYRHAFLILEKRNPGAPSDSAQLVRHVLCAESDADRDDWVDVLVRAIAEIDETAKEQQRRQQQQQQQQMQQQQQQQQGMPASPSYQTNNAQPFAVTPASPNAGMRPSGSGSISRRLRGGPAVDDAQPVSSPSFSGMAVPDLANRGSIPRASTPDTSSNDPNRPMKLPISGPLNGAPIPPGYKFGKDEASSVDSHGRNQDKKRFWQGLRNFGGERGKADPRPVFGVPLAEAVAISSHEGAHLPSVVFRCIEYLERRDAASEEGIYRLSGSSAVIKGLKDRFNAEGDVDLLAESYDPHAVAGLLKTFLRELPSSVLTRELHMEFMRVNDLANRAQRIDELGRLVSMLPMPNYALLRTLCGQ